jgi:hypothetical protein
MVTLISPVGNTKKGMGQTRTPENTRGGIKCLGKVSIPYQQLTPAAGLIFRSRKRNNLQSNSLCHEQPDRWYETKQTALALKEGCIGKLHV